VIKLQGITVKNLTGTFIDTLKQIYPDREIRQILFILFDEYLGLTRREILLDPDRIIPDKVAGNFITTLEKLASGKPLQYILKKAWFGDLTLYVDERVLIPRPETEELCSLIIRDLKILKKAPLNILDIGTGSGCIAISLKRAFPDLHVTAMDNSAPSLKIAGINAQNCKTGISFLLDDILKPHSLKDPEQYDLMVSNPPYVTDSDKKKMHRNVIDHEPATALFVSEEDPLFFYNAIIRYTHQKLKPGGKLYLEINERFGHETSVLLKHSGFEFVEVIPDLNGKDRFVTAALKSRKSLRSKQRL